MKVKLLLIGLIAVWILAIVVFVAEIPGLLKTADILRVLTPFIFGLVVLLRLSRSLKSLSLNRRNVSANLPLVLGVYVYSTFYPIFESSFTNYREFVKNFALLPLQVYPESAIFEIIDHGIYTKSVMIFAHIIIGVAFPMPALILGALATIVCFAGWIYVNEVWFRLRARNN